MMFRVGDRVRFNAARAEYYVDYETTVFALDRDGDPMITRPDGFKDTFLTDDLFGLVSIVETAASPEILTLRDQFAMAALTSLAPNSAHTDEWFSDTARKAYGFADAMLTERERAK